MKEKMEDVLHALANAFQTESDNKHLETVEKLIQNHHYLDITKPEQFGLLVSITLDEQKDLLARIALANVKIDTKKIHEVSFVYTHYEFIKRHLDRLIVSFEGFACSADKTRWLLDSYVSYTITGNLPVVEEKGYWQPDFLEMELWMKWIRSCQSLYYGDEEEFVKTKQIIKEKYQDIIQAQVNSLHEQLTANARFVAISEEEENGQTKKIYHFVDELTKDKGTIIVDPVGGISYRFYIEKDKRFAKYSDTLPDWFKEILAINH